MHTFVIPVPTIGGYRNLLAQCRDSATTGTYFATAGMTSYLNRYVCDLVF